MYELFHKGRPLQIWAKVLYRKLFSFSWLGFTSKVAQTAANEGGGDSAPCQSYLIMGLMYIKGGQKSVAKDCLLSRIFYKCWNLTSYLQWKRCRKEKTWTWTLTYCTLGQIRLTRLVQSNLHLLMTYQCTILDVPNGSNYKGDHHIMLV